MEQKILDDLLVFLKETKCDTFYSIESEIKNKSVILKDINSKMLHSALLKLVKDDYVFENYRNIGSLSGYTYNISFEGIFFINNGGYEKEHQNNQKTEIESAEMKKRQFLLEEKHSSIQFQLLVLTWVIAIGTSVAAIYYLLEVLKFLGVLTSCSCNN